MSEFVSCYFGNLPPAPYDGYVKSRNGTVARQIGDYLRIPYREDRELGDYTVLPAAMTHREAARLGIESVERYYGATVAHIDHVGKSIMHPTFASRPPEFYSTEFADQVRDVVLPGFTVFTADELLFALRQMPVEFGARFKLPNESDGHGQRSLQTAADLQELLGSIDPRQLAAHGAIVEADLLIPDMDAATISVGFADLAGDCYSFLARQKNDIDPADGRSRYRGARVLVAKGGFGEITAAGLTDEERTAVDYAGRFYQAYALLDPHASRLSFDVLQGFDRKGNQLRGVTDITGRLGGTCPALIQSANYLKDMPNGATVAAEVNLNYDPSQTYDYEEDAVLYVDAPELRLSARVLG